MYQTPAQTGHRPLQGAHLERTAVVRLLFKEHRAHDLGGATAGQSRKDLRSPRKCERRRCIHPQISRSATVVAGAVIKLSQKISMQAPTKNTIAVAESSRCSGSRTNSALMLERVRCKLQKAPSLVGETAVRELCRTQPPVHVGDTRAS